MAEEMYVNENEVQMNENRIKPVLLIDVTDDQSHLSSLYEYIAGLMKDFEEFLADRADYYEIRYAAETRLSCPIQRLLSKATSGSNVQEQEDDIRNP